MKYPLIHINGFMYAIDKRGNWRITPGVFYIKSYPIEVRCAKHSGWGDWNVIVATNDPSLNLLLLPAVERDIEQLAISAYMDEFAYNEKERVHKSFIDVAKNSQWAKGYKATSAKEFTEEDLRSMYFDGLLDGRFHGVPNDKEAEEQFQEKLKPLRPKPVAVEIQIEDITPINEVGNDGFEFDSSSTIPPKEYKIVVDENNFVKVKQWYFK